MSHPADTGGSRLERLLGIFRRGGSAPPPPVPEQPAPEDPEQADPPDRSIDAVSEGTATGSDSASGGTDGNDPETDATGRSDD